MHKIFYAIVAALIVAAPAAIDKASIAAKADGAAKQGVQARLAEAAEPGCRAISSRMRGLDGTVLVRNGQICG
jgi:hypothetical protein